MSEFDIDIKISYDGFGDYDDISDSFTIYVDEDDGSTINHSARYVLTPTFVPPEGGVDVIVMEIYFDKIEDGLLQTIVTSEVEGVLIEEIGRASCRERV